MLERGTYICIFIQNFYSLKILELHTLMAFKLDKNPTKAAR